MLCDEYALSRQSLSCLCGQWDDVQVVATVVESGAAGAALTLHRPGVVLVVAHSGSDPAAVAMLHDVTRRSPRCGVVLVVPAVSPALLVAAWDDGVNSVVEMAAEPEALHDALRVADSGIHAIPRLAVDEARVHLDAFGMSHWSELDNRARSILACLAEGMSDQQIAERLGLALQTVRNRVSRLLEEFAMTNRTQLAVALARAEMSSISEQPLFTVDLRGRKI